MNARVHVNRFVKAPAQRLLRAVPDENESEHSKVMERLPRAMPLWKSILTVLWGVTIVLGTAAGVTWAIFHYATTSPRFAIRELQVKGNSRVTEQQLRTDSGISLGDNLFKLNLTDVERRLLKNPWIESAKVTRRLPSGVNVEIQEREAAALALIASRIFLVDRLGHSFKEVAEPTDPTDMPMITGVSVDNASGDLGLVRQRIVLGLEVLNHYARSRLSKSFPAQEVHLTPGGEVIMTIGHKGTTLNLGAGPWSKKFAMAERILARLQAQRSMPAQIFLDNRANPDRVVVRVN
jgi:cell division protein FtsQ